MLQEDDRMVTLLKDGHELKDDKAMLDLQGLESMVQAATDAE